MSPITTPPGTSAIEFIGVDKRFPGNGKAPEVVAARQAQIVPVDVEKAILQCTPVFLRAPIRASER